MNSSDTRVSTYLGDLARMLADLDPATRDDVLAGVREHLDATLAEHADDPAAVDAALLRLGPPEQVAAAARADLPTADRYARSATPTAARHPRRARAAGLAALALLALPTSVALAARLTTELGADAGVGWPEDARMFLGPHPSEVLSLLPMTFPLWVVAVVVALLGPDLAGRTKAWLVALGPVMAASVLAGALLGDPRSFATPLVLVVLGGTAAGIVLTGRRVWRESRSIPESCAQVAAGATT